MRNVSRAASPRRNATKRAAPGCAPIVTATGYVIGGCVSSGNTSTTRTPGSILASVAYTMPSGTSPRATSASAARTFSERASFSATPSHTPSFVRAARA